MKTQTTAEQVIKNEEQISGILLLFCGLITIGKGQSYPKEGVGFNAGIVRKWELR